MRLKRRVQRFLSLKHSYLQTHTDHIDAYRVHVKRSESKKDFVRQIPNLLQYLKKRMERKASEMLLFSLKYTALL